MSRARVQAFRSRAAAKLVAAFGAAALAFPSAANITHEPREEDPLREWPLEDPSTLHLLPLRAQRTRGRSELHHGRPLAGELRPCSRSGWQVLGTGALSAAAAAPGDGPAGRAGGCVRRRRGKRRKPGLPGRVGRAARRAQRSRRRRQARPRPGRTGAGVGRQRSRRLAAVGLPDGLRAVPAARPLRRGRGAGTLLSGRALRRRRALRREAQPRHRREARAGKTHGRAGRTAGAAAGSRCGTGRDAHGVAGELGMAIRPGRRPRRRRSARRARQAGARLRGPPVRARARAGHDAAHRRRHRRTKALGEGQHRARRADRLATAAAAPHCGLRGLSAAGVRRHGRLSRWNGEPRRRAFRRGNDRRRDREGVSAAWRVDVSPRQSGIVRGAGAARRDVLRRLPGSARPRRGGTCRSAGARRAAPRAPPDRTAGLGAAHPADSVAGVLDLAAPCVRAVREAVVHAGGQGPAGGGAANRRKSGTSLALYQSLARVVEGHRRFTPHEAWDAFADVLAQITGIASRQLLLGAPSAEDERYLNELDGALKRITGGGDMPIVVDVHGSRAADRCWRRRPAGRRW